MGIHTGLVYAGILGSVARFKYGLLGDSLSVASFLEEANKRCVRVFVHLVALAQPKISDFVCKSVGWETIGDWISVHTLMDVAS